MLRLYSHALRAGDENRAIPPGGGKAGREQTLQSLPAGQGNGETRFPYMFTSGTIRGAHNPRMKIFLFLGGLRPPKPSRGRAIFTSEAGAEAVRSS